MARCCIWFGSTSLETNEQERKKDGKGFRRERAGVRFHSFGPCVREQAGSVWTFGRWVRSCVLRLMDLHPVCGRE